MKKLLPVAVKVKKHIEFRGEVECLTENEYLIENVMGNNANYEQESVISEYKATKPGDNGSMEVRCVNLNHHVTGDQRGKTELCTYNNFTNGYYLLESGQSVPCTKSISNREEYIGDLTIARHIIFRQPYSRDF